MISDDRFHYICIIIDNLNINEVNEAKFLEMKEKGKQQKIIENPIQSDDVKGSDKKFEEWSNLNYIKFHSIRRGLSLDEVNDLIKNYPGSKIQFLETPPDFFENLDNQYKGKFKVLEQQVQQLQQLLEKTPSTKLSDLTINQSIMIKSNSENLARLTDLMHQNNDQEDQNKLINQFKESFEQEESRCSNLQQLQAFIQKSIKDYKKQLLETLNKTQRDLFELILYSFKESVRLTNLHQERLMQQQSLALQSLILN